MTVVHSIETTQNDTSNDQTITVEAVTKTIEADYAPSIDLKSAEDVPIEVSERLEDKVEETVASAVQDAAVPTVVEPAPTHAAESGENSKVDEKICAPELILKESEQVVNGVGTVPLDCSEASSEEKKRNLDGEKDESPSKKQKLGNSEEPNGAQTK